MFLIQHYAPVYSPDDLCELVKCQYFLLVIYCRTYNLLSTGFTLMFCYTDLVIPVYVRHYFCFICMCSCNVIHKHYSVVYYSCNDHIYCSRCSCWPPRVCRVCISLNGKSLSCLQYSCTNIFSLNVASLVFGVLRQVHLSAPKHCREINVEMKSCVGGLFHVLF